MVEVQTIDEERYKEIYNKPEHGSTPWLNREVISYTLQNHARKICLVGIAHPISLEGFIYALDEARNDLVVDSLDIRAFPVKEALDSLETIRHNHPHQRINEPQVRDATNTDFPDGFYDYTYSDYLLNFIPDEKLKAFILEQLRIIAKDGQSTHVFSAKVPKNIQTELNNMTFQARTREQLIKICHELGLQPHQYRIESAAKIRREEMKKKGENPLVADIFSPTSDLVLILRQ